MSNKINKVIRDLRAEIRKEHSYDGKRWKRSHWNQPGVYDVKLNFQQIMILHEALKQKKGQNSFLWSTPIFSRKKWNTMATEILQDYKERIKRHEERR